MNSDVDSGLVNVNNREILGVHTKNIILYSCVDFFQKNIYLRLFRKLLRLGFVLSDKSVSKC